MQALVDDLDHTSIYLGCRDDSEESDGEAGLGNLNRLIVRPPGHSGKAKRGHLCFDAAFECGNLGRADHITELEYDLYIRPDTCRPRSRFWFNFTVENVKQDQRVIFNVVNLNKEQILYNEGMTPLVRSTSRQKWQRIPRRLLFYHRSAVHHNRKILSLAFGFDREEDVYQFAAAAPYSYSRLQKYLSAWEKRTQTFATRKPLAQTTHKRRVDLITIGDMHPKEKEFRDDDVGRREKEDVKRRVADAKKRLVLVLARTHGGEAPASFICQGLMDILAGPSEKAIALRNNIILQIVPMVNPDGVFLGNHRSDLLGSDLNRCWNSATPLAHPTIIAINDHLKKLKNDKSLQLDFIIDVHADVSHEGVFVRGTSYDDVYRFERHAVLPKFLGTRVEAWSPERCLYNADASVCGCARRTLADGVADAYTLLASLGGRRLGDKAPYMHYTEDAYMKIGRSLAKGLCDYYRHINIIPPRISSNNKKETRRRRRQKRRVYERERSPSSSPERRVLAARVLSPRLPLAAPPATRVPHPPRTARAHTLAARPRSIRIDALLPAITGKAVTPMLSVVDLSAHIRTPHGHKRTRERRAAYARPPRPAHAHLTSDDYDTQETDS